MALGGTNRPKPGLKAVYEGREQRKPGGKYGRPSTAVYLLGVGAVLASLVVYKVVDEYELASDRRELLSQQRAMKSTIGAVWGPLEEQIVSYVVDAAKSFQGDFVDSEAARWDFRSQPGLYLRMRVADAKDAASVRAAAAESQKDAFTGCFLREANPLGLRGEVDGGAFPEQPWNLGQAYRATRVLGDDWAEGVKAADDKMRLRVFKEQYEKAAKVDMKVAADIVKQARFLLLVLDEDSPDAKGEDGRPVDEAAIQLVPHWARVHVLDLRTKNELLRLRRESNGAYRPVGEQAITDPETRAALQRQVNNCALAQWVGRAIADKAGDAGAAAGPDAATR